MTGTRLLLILVALMAALGTAACGGSQVGNQSLFNGSSQTPGNFNFPTPSASAAAAIGTQGAAPSATPRAAPSPTPPPSTPRPVATSQPAATPTPPPSAFQITIYGDTASQTAFQPPAANVYQGSMVTFTNRDTQPRSVVSDSGDPVSFDSGMIAPGASWSYTASTPGSYSYHDGTRPYAVASFKVVSR